VGGVGIRAASIGAVASGIAARYRSRRAGTSHVRPDGAV
jgi:hypothetical protein